MSRRGLVCGSCPPLRYLAEGMSQLRSDGVQTPVHHEAIVAGAGAAGLAAAALLRKRGVEVVVLERAGAVGARWRTRYEPLRLNTARVFSTLPGYRIPRRFGRYPRREDFVAYLERYARHHQLSVRFNTELKRIDRSEDGWWRLETSGGALLARYAVVATGYDAVPKLPDVPGRERYTGELIHAADFRSPEPYRGRDVLIVGAGNTGVDIAGHLVAAGARVSVAMRTPPNIFPRDWLGMPLQATAIAADRMPAKFADAVGFLLQRLIFGDLSPYGVPRAPEGFETKFRRRLVGAAVDDGFVDALKTRRARVLAQLQRLEGSEAVLVDGTRLRPDAIIFATGYRRGLEPIVGHLGVLRPDGIPVHHGGAPEHPAARRLYFAGFWGSNAGQIRLMPIHARRIARAAARDRAKARVADEASPIHDAAGARQPAPG
jgi:putative flavoprotein involved in K+ transport